jgi:glucan biosynthesis protein
MPSLHGVLLCRAGDLSRLDREVQVGPAFSAPSGQIGIPSARPLDAVRGYGAPVDLTPACDSVAPVNLGLRLGANGRTPIETCLYQWTPDRRTL